MPFTQPLDYIPVSAMFIATIGIAWAGIEGGFRLGRRRVRRPEHEREAPVGVGPNPCDDLGGALF
jgi:hypothetical protein